MKALRYHHFGSPTEALQLDDIPAAEPGAGEVRVRLTLRSINPADLATVKGAYGKRPALPAVAGNEGVGIVDALGSGVKDLEVGQRVVPIAAGPTWQEQLVAPADHVLSIPESVPDEAAAQLVVNPLTAWLLLDAAGQLDAGDVVLLSAGASAVARCVTQMGAPRGVQSVHVVRSDHHADTIRELGGKVVVAAENSEASRKALTGAIGGSRAVAAFDPVAGDIGALLLHALGDGGTHVVYGSLSGESFLVSPKTLIYRNVVIKGMWRTRWVETTPIRDVKAALAAIIGDIESGALTLPVERSYDLTDWGSAITAATSHGRWGKVLLAG